MLSPQVCPQLLIQTDGDYRILRALLTNQIVHSLGREVIAVESLPNHNYHDPHVNFRSDYSVVPPIWFFFTRIIHRFPMSLFNLIIHWFPQISFFYSDRSPVPHVTLQSDYSLVPVFPSCSISSCCTQEMTSMLSVRADVGNTRTIGNADFWRYNTGAWT